MKGIQLDFLKKQAQVFCLAFVFSLPILSGAFFLSFELQKTYIIFNSFFALCALLALIKVPKKTRFYFGFYTGVLLFYWISLSFRFSPMPWLMPLIILAVASIYGVIFTFLLWFENIFFRCFSVFILGFIHPFYFDWLFVESFFAYSIFGVDKISLFCILVALVLFLTQEGRKKTLAVLFLFIATLQTDFKTAYNSPLQIQLVHTSIPQKIRWDQTSFNEIVRKNFEMIKQAKEDLKEMIIFPETAFPTLLNQDLFLLKELKEQSRDITIVAGGLRADNQQVFNSTYIFNQGKVEIIDKVVLAPFGEKIPLPDFLAKPLQKIFFNTTEGFVSAEKPKDFKVKNFVFRNAICYEGTSSIIYKDKPKYVVVISNNAWFDPSIEPFFQQILLKYYARISKSLILHSANSSNSMIISPSLF
ncbi:MULTISPECIES: apolipoprotein N-acyltransferase [unclassified Helicobacter]|uniref:apolipoprotein N-acyltransferase n=1 Tax=unclassified Helicobacter TaxID=2593540 RepID=UPI000CF1A48F|nr:MULTISPECIES: apolipoprotein N-acyltransferase [unclassified Helicobacter]